MQKLYGTLPEGLGYLLAPRVARRAPRVPGTQSALVAPTVEPQAPLPPLSGVAGRAPELSLRRWCCGAAYITPSARRRPACVRATDAIRAFRGLRRVSGSTVDYRVEPLIPILSSSVSVVAADLADGSACYLDCRSEEEYAAGIVPGSINFPYPHNGNREPVDAEEFLEDVLAEGFRYDDKIYVGCRKGPRSAMACEVLINAGFTCVFNVEGGIQEWVAKDLPIHPFTG